MLGDEAIDGSRKIQNGVEHTAPQLSLCQLGKEAFDGIERGTRRWCEVKGNAGITNQHDQLLAWRDARVNEILLEHGSELHQHWDHDSGIF